MQQILIKQIKEAKKVSLKDAGFLLESNTVYHLINTINWPDYGYQPKVRFKIAHTGNEILLKYQVAEKYILAMETHTNGDVYKDSCVEFFISLDGKNYYNFEFNCIGTVHIGYGSGRKNRKPVPVKLAEKINTKSSLGNQPFEEKKGNFNWEMMIRIPLETFVFDEIDSFNRLKATANFYKCGDETSEPHFLTWNPVDTKNPDYHRPESFGKVVFE
jgi:hypothetical protein